jgi:hypothetical protein
MIVGLSALGLEDIPFSHQNAHKTGSESRSLEVGDQVDDVLVPYPLVG